MTDGPEKKKSSNWPFIAGFLLVAVLIGGWFWIDSQPEGSKISRAFCEDLDNGYTLMNLWPRDMDPAEFADKAWGYIATTCPEHYAPNRDYFDGWGKPPIDD